MPYSREFDFPDRFEREKSTRIQPEDLKKMGFYTLRMMMPPDSKPFAVEFASVVTGVERKDNAFDVSYVLKPSENKDFRLMGSDFNLRGFMVIYNDGSLEGQPDEIEMAYFVGSLDPYDLALGDLMAQAHDLTRVGAEV